MLHVILRTCDHNSLQSTRIVDKKECILRCLKSLLLNLDEIEDKHLHIIDDGSSIHTIEKIKLLIEPYSFVTLQKLSPRNDCNSVKKKSRYSVKIAYEYIYNLPENDLVYIVEDDYLHYPGCVSEMLETWKYFDSIFSVDVGIFPQDFNQLYFDPSFPFNDTYFKPCMVVPAKNRYYRTTWYTHESFMIQSKIFKKYKEHFDSLLNIGDDEGNWEGNTISNVWMNPEFAMFMPIGSLVIHLSNSMDIPFFITEKEVGKLWDFYKTPYSENDTIKLTAKNIRKWT